MTDLLAELKQNQSVGVFPQVNSGLRADGTTKGSGFFGVQKMTDGTNRDMTEFSIGVDFGRGEIQIPSLVPTLTSEELEYLKSGNDPTPEIEDKAIRHAEQRLSQGRSPFIEQGEEVTEQPKSGPVDLIAEMNQSKRPERKIVTPEIDTDRVPFIVDLFTGANRTTPELEALSNIGSAPELNEMSMRAFKASAGTFTTGNLGELQNIIKEQFGDDVEFTKDSKGNPIANFESGSYALNKPGMSIGDIPKFFGDLAAFSPAGRANTIRGAVVKSALGEGVLEGLDVTLGGEFDIEEVAESAVLGGAFKTIEDAVVALKNLAKGKIAAPEEQLLREAEEAGIPVLTSDILAPETFVGKTAQQVSEKIPLAGTGAIRETQQQFRQEAVEEIAKKYDSFSYDTIIQSLKDQKTKVKTAAGNVLEYSGNKLDDFGDIPLNNTNKAIVGALEELNKPGVIKAGTALKDLDELINALSGAPQTYKSLKENRTAFREIVDSLDPTSRSQLTSRSKSLLNNVYSGMTNDMRSFAKENLTPQEFMKLNKANEVYANEAKKLSKTRLKSVLDKGDFKPESVKQMLFSQNPSEIKLLYGSLTNEGRANARAAVVSKIVADLTKRQSGFTPSSFATELKKYPNQIEIFFKGTEKKQLEGLRKVLESTRRAQEASIATPTGQQLIPLATGAAAATDLGLTTLIGGTAGGIARLYESAPVRNALLKLAGTPKGSSQFEKVLADARYALTVGAQSLQTEE